MNLRIVLAAMLMLAGVAFATDKAEQPQQIVKSAANEALEVIEARRDELRKDPQELYRVVDKILLPHFDTEYAARLILAQHGREATDEQRQRFQEAMYQSLVRTYADGLLEFTSDSMKMLPMRGEPDDKRATVRTEIVLDGGTRAPVNYILRKSDGQWKVFDVYIEGRSYVLNYREQLDARIRQEGLEAVIQRLEKDPETIEAVTPEAR